MKNPYCQTDIIDINDLQVTDTIYLLLVSA